MCVDVGAPHPARWRAGQLRRRRRLCARRLRWRRRRCVVGVVGVGVGAAGCPLGGVACTDLAAVSVTATVEDEAGDPVDDADVVFRVDGGDEQDCSLLSDGQYSCGFEVEGAIVVTARKAGFVDAESGAVDVVEDADGCHVVGQSVTLTLVAQDG